MNAHDKKTFKFLEAEMHRFARRYCLPFKGLLTIHKQKRTKDFDGFCHSDGRIGIRIRRSHGRPLETYSIIDTMAHELAHLRYMEHSPRWFRLHVAILGAMAYSDLFERLNWKMKS